MVTQSYITHVNRGEFPEQVILSVADMRGVRTILVTRTVQIARTLANQIPVDVHSQTLR